MTIERKTVMLVVDESFPAEMQKLDAEGWKIADEAKPVAVYHLFREVGVDGLPFDMLGAKLKLSVDDSKIGILRADGTHEAADGTRTPPQAQT